MFNVWLRNELPLDYTHLCISWIYSSRVESKSWEHYFNFFLYKVEGFVQNDLYSFLKLEISWLLKWQILSFVQMFHQWFHFRCLQRYLSPSRENFWQWPLFWEPSKSSILILTSLLNILKYRVNLFISTTLKKEKNKYYETSCSKYQVDAVFPEKPNPLLNNRF